MWIQENFYYICKTKNQIVAQDLDHYEAEAGFILRFVDLDEAIATCRVFEGSEKNKFIFGRLAVIMPYRGMNIGTKMIREAEKLVLKKGGTSMSLHAQCRVKSFYEKLGYTEFGEIDDDEGCPHIWMNKQI